MYAEICVSMYAYVYVEVCGLWICVYVFMFRCIIDIICMYAYLVCMHIQCMY